VTNAATNADERPRSAEDKKRLYAPALEKMAKRPKQEAEYLDKSEIVKANSFRLNLDSKVQLHRYSITLGEIEYKSRGGDRNGAGGQTQTKTPTNRDTKRALIESFLTAPNSKPMHSNWATDYDSTIISVGQLYPGSSSKLNQVTFKDHPRMGRPGEGNLQLTSSVKFLGIVGTAALNSYVGLDSSAGKKAIGSGSGSGSTTAVTYDPSSDLNAFNIILWKEVNKPDSIGRPGFRGGRVGNRFYPTSTQVETPAQQSRKCYLIRGGFSTSVRPADGSILLNVNTVTSAFYSPINLQTWMQMQWSSHPKSKDFRAALKGVKVTFDLAKDGHGRKWVIFDRSEVDVSKLSSLWWIKMSLCRNTWKVSHTGVSPYQARANFSWPAYPSYKNSYNLKAYCINVGSKADPT
jgi:hypothetical protein